MYCYKCGKEIKEEYEYCVSCGLNLREDISIKTKENSFYIKNEFKNSFKNIFNLKNNRDEKNNSFVSIAMILGIIFIMDIIIALITNISIVSENLTISQFIRSLVNIGVGVVIDRAIKLLIMGLIMVFMCEIEDKDRIKYSIINIIKWYFPVVVFQFLGHITSIFTDLNYVSLLYVGIVGYGILVYNYFINEEKLSNKKGLGMALTMAIFI